MSTSPKTIMVDLTPILPGGENGGAKVFVLELLAKLAHETPDTNFILLTQSAAHEELKIMDRENMSRVMVENSSGRKSFLAKAVAYAFRKIPIIPAKISIIGYRTYAKLRRHSQKELLDKISPDLIFCPFTAPTYAIPGIPTICVIYDLQYIAHPDFFEAQDRTNRSHAFTEACRCATKLVAISEYSRKSALTHGNIAPTNIKTIHLRMAKRTLIHKDPIESLLHSLNIKSQQYLLYPANFWLHKNHEMLLTALKMAYSNKDITEDIKLVCTGSPGKRQQWLIDSANKMGLKSQVIFTGYLKDVDLETLMNNCVGVVFPSLYEGFGLPILEAMAANVPVACSNTSSLPEVAGDGALFFDPRIPSQIASAMTTLISDKNKRQELMEIGSERVKKFCDSSKMREEYWDVFQKACLTEKN
jgi:glycosyltransferase involved in cell wall biosynthesis